MDVTTRSAPGRVGLAVVREQALHASPGHPERPERIQAILAALRDAELEAQLVPVDAPLAKREDLLLVHAPEQIAAVQAASAAGGGALDADTYVTVHSYDVARRAAGAVIALVDAVLDGRVSHGLAVVRPPGHHATSTRAMGFCLFNNVAIAVRHAQRRRGVARALIADWDVHHGNGTQEIFYRDGTVGFLSTHQWPQYPGTGAASERGAGAGEGLIVNVPLAAGCGDAELVEAFGEKLLLLAERVQPQLVLVSAGFDAHVRDPLGGLAATAEGFAKLTRSVLGLGKPVVLVLEGGYDLSALGESSVAVTRALLGERT